MSRFIAIHIVFAANLLICIAGIAKVNLMTFCFSSFPVDNGKGEGEEIKIKTTRTQVCAASEVDKIKV